MTDKERVEEYARKVHYDLIQCGDSEEQDLRLYVEIKFKQAYLDGLAEGKPKWHKIADGDYPPCEKGNCTINILTDRGNIAYYNYDEECWVAEPSSAEINPPVAWCKIPKYTKENEQK